MCGFVSHTLDFDVFAPNGVRLGVSHLFPLGSDADFFTEDQTLLHHEHLLDNREDQSVAFIVWRGGVLDDAIYRCSI